MIVWTAGVQSAPFVKSNSDLPVDERGRLRARADLRVEGDEGVVRDAWAAGDVAAVPDLSGGGVGGFCVPNAQHAVRQAKHLAGNLVATLRGEAPRDYYHENLGAVAGLGPWLGSFRMNDLQLDGVLPWFAHRGYHGMAMPTVERKIRVVSDWINEFVLGRDFASLPEIGNPRGFFEKFAARPKPKPADEAPAAPAAPAEPAAEVSSTPAETEAKGDGADASAAAESAAPAEPATSTAPASTAGSTAKKSSSRSSSRSSRSSRSTVSRSAKASTDDASAEGSSEAAEASETTAPVTKS